MVPDVTIAVNGLRFLYILWQKFSLTERFIGITWPVRKGQDLIHGWVKHKWLQATRGSEVGSLSFHCVLMFIVKEAPSLSRWNFDAGTVNLVSERLMMVVEQKYAVRPKWREFTAYIPHVLENTTKEKTRFWVSAVLICAPEVDFNGFCTV